MSDFWVYENVTHRYVRVHRRNCCMCNNGKGMHARGPGRDGRWHPARTLEHARHVAQQLGHPTIADCETCGHWGERLPAPPTP